MFDRILLILGFNHTATNDRLLSLKGYPYDILHLKQLRYAINYIFYFYIWTYYNKTKL